MNRDNIKGQNIWREDRSTSNKDGTITVLPTWYMAMPCSVHSELKSCIVKIMLVPYRTSMHGTCIYRVPTGKAGDFIRGRLNDILCGNKKCPFYDEDI